MDELRATHQKAIAAHVRALPYLRPPGERVVIPFDGKELAAVFRRPLDAGRAPVVLMAMGLDSAKEEMAAYQQTFLDRGLAVLTIDGPGQGESEYAQPTRGDFEATAKAAIDWLERRTDVDAKRVGIWGASMGGYYAARACCVEQRISACVSMSGPYDWGDLWDGLPPLTREGFRVRSHAATPADAKKHATMFSLKGIAKQIVCPIFIIAGKRDKVVPYTEAEKIAAEVSGPVEFLIVDSNHVINTRPYLNRPQAADWLAQQLALVAV
jgi:dipeptidyl aminopeptidase/acylaminoacyl peptidase